MSKPQITEAQAEAIADILVQSAMDTDRAYKHAESAEAQRDAEVAIEHRVWDYIEDTYEIA
jgi:hypothetical protein